MKPNNLISRFTQAIELIAVIVICVLALYPSNRTKPTVASPNPQTVVSILTQQSRFLDGVQNAPWGPVLLKATGGTQPYTWSNTGTLPPGITLTSAGRIEGTPTATGFYDFTVTVTAGTTAQRSFRIRINSLTEVKHPSLKSTELPFGYVQSALFVGTGQSAANHSKEETKALIKMYQKKFAGGEIYLTSLENSTDFATVRDVNQAIADVRTETGKDFIGLFGGGRFPNFSQPEDLSGHADQRAISLKSNGSTWTREPAAFSKQESLYGIEGVAIDITNDTAVNSFLDSLRTAYDQDGALDQSVGPLNGFYVYNEPRLSPIYIPFANVPGSPDNDDLIPKTSARPTCQWTGLTMSPPVLKYGDPCTLYANGDPKFNWLAGPRRAVPLYSQSAKNKFVQYAAAKGVTVTKLPADPDEFNLDTTQQVPLPVWVEFVPRSNTAIWNVWEQWVYETWSGHLEKIARTITFAQAGNPNFRGVIFFQFPGIYSFNSVKSEQFQYQYYNAGGTLVTSPSTVTLAANSAIYNEFNNPVHGNEIDLIARSPWIQGIVHETTTPLFGVPGSTADRSGDNTMLTSPKGIFQWNQESEMAKRVARRYNKFFGLFARYTYFTSGEQVVWVDDGLPQNAVPNGVQEGWSWINANPAPKFGGLAHQSPIRTGMHQHLFDSTTAPLTPAVDDLLVTYIYLESGTSNLPKEIMLQWFADGNWNHRAYWGENRIDWGLDNSTERRNMGALPAPGQWVRLEVPASEVGLVGRTITGMAFTLFDGKATWDRAGLARRYGELTPADFSWNWDRHIPLFNPDLVSTLPPGYFVNVDDMEFGFKSIVPPIDGPLTQGVWPGDLGPSWLSRMSTLAGTHAPPPAWNPRSLGTIDTFNGVTASGWAYDPWSTSTSIAVFVTSSPNGCYTGPTRVGYIQANGSSTPARDTSIRTAIKSGANYIPVGDMKFEYSVDLPTFLRNNGVVCKTGNYQVQMRVQDGQGDALTSLLSFAGNNTLTVPVDQVWIEDSLPAGARSYVQTDSSFEFIPWNWVSSNPAPFSGSLATQLSLYPTMHQYAFDSATSTLAINTGDTLVAYVYLDPGNAPQEIMLQWCDGVGWNHRAYWGQNLIAFGTNGTNTRRYIGALPATGAWVRLEVPASQVGLEGTNLTGMAFTLYGGRATLDRAGKR